MALAPRVRRYAGRGECEEILECEWRRSDGVEAAGLVAALAPAALLKVTGLPIIATLIKIGGTWKPWTLAAESWVMREAGLAAQMGVYMLCPMRKGVLLGYLTGRRLGVFRAGARAGLERAAAAAQGARLHSYAFTTRRHGGGVILWDGGHDRPGGLCCANDARGTAWRNNAARAWAAEPGEYDEEAAIRAVRNIAAVRVGTQLESLSRHEVLWSYGSAFWRDSAGE